MTAGPARLSGCTFSTFGHPDVASGNMPYVTHALTGGRPVPNPVQVGGRTRISSLGGSGGGMTYVGDGDLLTPGSSCSGTMHRELLALAPPEENVSGIEHKLLALAPDQDLVFGQRDKSLHAHVNRHMSRACKKRKSTSRGQEGKVAVGKYTAEYPSL